MYAQFDMGDQEPSLSSLLTHSLIFLTSFFEAVHRAYNLKPSSTKPFIKTNTSISLFVVIPFIKVIFSPSSLTIPSIVIDLGSFPKSNLLMFSKHF